MDNGQSWQKRRTWMVLKADGDDRVAVRTCTTARERGTAHRGTADDGAGAHPKPPAAKPPPAPCTAPQARPVPHSALR